MPSQKESAKRSPIALSLPSKVVSCPGDDRGEHRPTRDALPNVVSKRPYSGINPLLLTIAAMQHGFQSKWWATFHQWQQLGCQVKKRPANIEPGDGEQVSSFASR